MAKKWTSKPCKRYSSHVLGSSIERAGDTLLAANECIHGTSLSVSCHKQYGASPSTSCHSEHTRDSCKEDQVAQSQSENIPPFPQQARSEHDIIEEEIVIEEQEKQLQQDLSALKRRREQLRMEKLKRELRAQAEKTMVQIEDQLQEKLQSQILELLKCKDEKMESFACYQREVDRQIKQLQILREQAVMQAEGLELEYIEAVEQLRREHRKVLSARKEEVEQLVKSRLEREVQKFRETSANTCRDEALD
eukprot:416187-Hanusia_phi.AAC.2